MNKQKEELNNKIQIDHLIHELQQDLKKLIITIGDSQILSNKIVLNLKKLSYLQINIQNFFFKDINNNIAYLQNLKNKLEKLESNLKWLKNDNSQNNTR